MEQSGRGYAVSPQKRSRWLKTDDGFGVLDLNDSVKGRRFYIQRLEDQARQGVNAPELSEHQSLQSTLHRGWYWGSEQFREFLLKKVDAAAIRRNRNYQSLQMGRDHGQAEAEKIVQQGLERSGLSESDLKSLSGSDPRRCQLPASFTKARQPARC
jgi:putative transposase